MSIEYRTDRIGGLTLRADGIVRGVIRRAGVLNYVRADSAGRPVVSREFIPADTLDDPAALASLVGCFVTVDHTSIPAHPSEAIGAVVEARRDGDVLVASMRIDGHGARRDIELGKLRELSAGYRLDFEARSGVCPAGEPYDGVQRLKRYDHIALLPPGKARCGPTCSLRADCASDVPCSCASAVAMDGAPFEVGYPTLAERLEHRWIRR